MHGLSRPLMAGSCLLQEDTSLCDEPTMAERQIVSVLITVRVWHEYWIPVWRSPVLHRAASSHFLLNKNQLLDTTWAQKYCVKNDRKYWCEWVAHASKDKKNLKCLCTNVYVYFIHTHKWNLHSVGLTSKSLRQRRQNICVHLN